MGEWGEGEKRGRKRGEGKRREREGKTKRGKHWTEKEWIKGKREAT